MIRLWATVFAAAAGLAAQSGFTSCEPPAGLAAAVDRARSPMLPFAARMEALEQLLDRYPEDVFIGRAYLAELGGYAKLPLYDRVALPRFERLYRENPASAPRAYLYAVAIARRDPEQSLSILKRLAADQPDSPWPQLALAKQAASESLEKFASLCPATLDLEALDRIATDGSVPLRSATAARLRKQIAGRSDRQSLASWPALWQLEFQLTPANGHAGLRGRIREDMAALRKLESGETLLDTLYQGYKLATDLDGEHWAQEELLRAFPQSRAAADAALERWSNENPHPIRSAPYEEQAAFRRKEFASSADWVKRWPNYDAAWRPRVSMAMAPVEGFPAEQLASLANAVLDCMERNPDLTFGFTDQTALEIAESMATAGVELANVPKIVGQALEQANRRTVSDMAARRKTLNETLIHGIARIEREHAHKILVTTFVRMNQPERAAVELEDLRKEVAATPPGDLLTLWRGLTRLAEAAIEANRKDLARETIARMSSALAEEKPGTPREEIQRSQHEASWWEWRGRLAESEARKPDAGIFYWRAAEAIPGDADPRGRTRLAARAKALWTEAGGSPEALTSVAAVPAQASRWTTVDTRMPAFAPLDAFAGKTVFINVWATWCGPCQAELPFVEKIFQRLKDRADVRVVTLNLDENPGVVEPYMKQRGFTFPVLLAREFVEQDMKVDGIPRNWIVDAKGVLRLERQGGADESVVTDVLAAIERIARQ